MPSVSDLAIACATLGFLALLRRVRQHGKAPYPPGPKGLPVLGNIFDVPEKGQWIEYAKWAQEYNSPIISFNMLGQRIVILNDLKTVVDLFEKRGAIYSDRPRMPMLNEASGFNWNWGFSSDKNKWKICRREFLPHFRQVASRQYRPQETAMARGLIYKILNKPEKFYEDCRYMTGSLVLDMTYGMKVKPEDDEYISIAEKGSEGLEKSVDKNIVDIIPWIQHVPSWMSVLPGFRWKADVEEYRRLGFEMRDAPYAWLQEQLKRGVAKSCLTTVLADQLQDKWADPSYTEDMVKCMAGTLYIAGSDTTVGVIRFVILIVILYPNVLREAQEELDRVVGTERLPEFSDEPNLPYVTAVIKELLRWTAPITLAHATSEDDVYNGWFIPRNSMVIGNSYAILHNPETYPDPSRFNPKRFLTADGKIDSSVPDPMLASFGYGRRICPGRFQALDTVWIAAASILAVFDITNAIGPDGNKIVPAPEPDSGIVNHPQPFKCSIKPRSDKAASLIRRAYATTLVE
ncbi:cytochrome P450 [Mycena vitilis]|nr:cytochrome P450 [Mycena vitilis]